MNINRGWHVEIWGLKICILANFEHVTVTWRFLKDPASAGEFWMLARTLDACANFASGNMMSGKFWSIIWYPRWTHHQASRTLRVLSYLGVFEFLQNQTTEVTKNFRCYNPRQSYIRHFIRDPGAWKDTLGYNSKGGDGMRWDEMNRDMWLPCMQHDLVTYPRKCMTWHDKRHAGSWVSRIPYREQVQVHASMNPSTTSSIALLSNIGRWAVAPLLIPFYPGFSTHTQEKTMVSNILE